MRILLVEDEAPLRETLAARLKRDGFAVDAAQDGEEGLYLGREVPFDLAIIDLGLPKLSGMDLVKALREHGQRYPILILTARGSWQDKVEGLKHGADDYLVKPFHLDELAARIRSLARRVRGDAVNQLEAGALSLDLGNCEVTWHGEKIDLTRREFALLQALMERAGRIVRREALEASLYGPEAVMSTSALEVLVHALRRKIGHDAIQTVRGFGYMVPREPK